MRPTKASARRRVRNNRFATAMDGRNRANSDAMKGLLGRQLASITDTLSRASQRRDAELQKKTTPKQLVASAVQPPPAQSPTNPSLTADIEEARDSNCSDSIVFDSRKKELSIKNFPSFELGLPQSNSIMDSDNPQASLHEGYISYDDQKKMLARLDGANSVESAHDMSSSKSKVVDMARSDSVLGVHSNLGKSTDIDPKRVLAEFDRASSAGQSTIRDDVDNTDRKRLFADFENNISLMGEAIVEEEIEDFPRRMLAELDQRIFVASVNKEMIHDTNDDPKAVLADLERKKSLVSQEPADDNKDSLEALYSRLSNVQSLVYGQKALETDHTDAQLCSHTNYGSSEVSIDKAIIPYVIALQLEHAECKWEEAKGWTTYLFSKGFDNHDAQREKYKVIAQATEELDRIIEHVLCEEERYSKTKEKTRLVVSNVAADASEEDLKEFFYHDRFDLKEVKILPGRDLIKRTKVAYVDMFTRKAAIRAGFRTGSIFGLVLDIKLAVETEVSQARPIQEHNMARVYSQQCFTPTVTHTTGQPVSRQLRAVDVRRCLSG